MENIHCSGRPVVVSRAILQSASLFLSIVLALLCADSGAAQSLNQAGGDNGNLKFLNDRSFSEPVLVT